MKKVNQAIFLAFICMIAGCEKANNEMKNDLQSAISITSQSGANQVAYAELNLMKIGAEVAILAKDRAFVNFVKAEVGKKFDDEYEVLIDDLKKNPIWSFKLGTTKITEGLSAFKNLDAGRAGSFYPQIYMPNMQYKEDESISNLSSSGLDDQIYYVFFGGNSEDMDELSLVDEKKMGYILNQNDSLVEWGLIDGAFANENDVWILSLNESVNSQGRLAPICEDGNGNTIPCGGGTGGGGTGGGTGGGGVDPDFDPVESSLANHPTVDDVNFQPVKCKIENMSVRVYYESWLAGKSEVCIKANLSCHNNRALGALNGNVNDAYYRSNQYSNKLGKFVRKFSRKEIKRQTSVPINYSLQTGWSSLNVLSDPIFFNYIIFERDIWPVGFNTVDRGARLDHIQNPVSVSNANRTDFRAKENPGSFSLPTYSMYAKASIVNKPFSFPNAGTFLQPPYNSGIRTTFYDNGIVEGLGIVSTQTEPFIVFNTKAY